MAGSASSIDYNGNGLLVVPRVANPEWAQAHGAPRVDSVMVHGLNGHRWSTWSYGKVMWPQDLLPDKIAHARIMTFGYNADFVRNFSVAEIRDHSRDLLGALRDKRENTEEIDRPIIFVCHSLGGIVVKQALRLATNEAQYKCISESTKGIVFLGTPHRGSDAASYAKVLANIGKIAFLKAPSKLVDDLKSNSRALEDISEDFRSIADKYAITSFYESNEVNLRLSGKVIVPKTSALMQVTHEDPGPIDGNHMEIARFSGSQDERFERVWKAINRMIPVPLVECSRFKPEEVKFLDLLGLHSGFKLSSHLRSIPNPTMGTFSWVQHHESYESWENCRSGPFLHITGKQGSGKSVLSKMLWEIAKKDPGWSACAYFSFSTARCKRNSRQLYASLLQQILQTDPAICTWARKACDDEVQDGLDVVDFPNLLRLSLQRMKRTLILIDGLDECENDKTDVLQFFRSLREDVPEYRGLFTSRHDERISTYLGKETPIIDLNREREHVKDIRRYIDSEVESLVFDQPDLESLKHKIKQKLRKRADGMFLLVRLMILDLRSPKAGSRSKLRSSAAEVGRALQSLPQTLGQAYAAMFDKVEEEDRELAKHVLGCILYSTRRMNLDEWRVATAMTNLPDNMDDLESEMSLNLLHDLNLIFGPLIEENEGHIGFMHATVRDFLSAVSKEPPIRSPPHTQSTSDSGPNIFDGFDVTNPPWYSVSKDDANISMLSLCFRYLRLAAKVTRKEETLSHDSSLSSSSGESSADSGEDEVDVDSSDSEPIAPSASPRPAPLRTQYDHGNESTRSRRGMMFRDYIAENLDEHCRRIPKSNLGARQKTLEFFNCPVAWYWFKLYWDFRDRDRNAHNLSPLHMACLLGLRLLVKDLLGTGWTWRVEARLPDQGFITPLEMAVEGGDVTIVKMLLDEGADMDWHWKTHREILATAAWYGQNNVIDHFLTRGVDLFQTEMKGSTSLDAAIEAGRESTILHLIECAKRKRQADGTNSSDSQYGFPGYPIHSAIRAGRLNIIQTLTAAGFPIWRTNWDGYNSFHIAASSGSLEVLRACQVPGLLDLKTNDGHNALLVAVENLQTASVEYLLEQGADVNTKFQGKPALELALRQRWRSQSVVAIGQIAHLLFRRGMQISSEEETQFIDNAVRADQSSALEQLLRNRNEREEIDSGSYKSGWKMIHLALSQKASRCASVLINNLPPELRKSALEARGDKHQSALHVAVKTLQDNRNIVDQILQEGVEVDQIDCNGRTPLFCMLANPHWNLDLEVAKLLLEYGADPNLRTEDGFSPISIYLKATTVVVGIDVAGGNTAKKHMEFLRVVADYDVNLKRDDFIFRYKWSTESAYIEDNIRPVLWHMLVEPPGKLRSIAEKVVHDGNLTENHHRQAFSWAQHTKDKKFMKLISKALSCEAG